jgi:NAD(P)-dependent dehydrogenase (short-subunit alcohol dehydrogenase family)
MKRLEGKVAIITGSTAGIGRASAELFAEEGASVVINGRHREAGEEVVRAITAKGGKASFFLADVSKADEVKSLIQYAMDTYGRLDILMNNAYSGRGGSVVAMSEADWDYTFAATIKAVALACKYAIPLMQRGGGGSIINISSVQGLGVYRENAAYNTFKAALINLSRQMAVDFGRSNIRVNAICPGRIVTESKIEFLKARPDEARRQKYVYPLGRPGTMREAAYAALFLASDESSFITGHALVVDGGLTAQLADAASKYVEERVLEELGMSGK